MKSPPIRIPAPDAVAAAHSRRLLAVIRDAAAARGGLLPFDRYMELALYAPGLGYYMTGTRKLGPAGDFVTAPELSPLFGACIAAHCREVLAVLGEGRQGDGDLLEFGAGSGALAAQILASLAKAAALPRNYLILEPSPELRARQQRLLAQQVPELAARVRWLDRLPPGFKGCILANEVLDAMPVHRFRIGTDGRPQEIFVRPVPHGREDGLEDDVEIGTDGRPQEIFVRPVPHGREDGLEDDVEKGLEEVAAAPRHAGLVTAVHRLQAQGLALAPGYESELNLRLGPWMRALGDMLEWGSILLIDYGYPRAEYYRDDRSCGTLLCHYRHRAHPDPYLYPGLQDITAHVDFTAVAAAGARAGLRLAGFTTQAHFLIGCGLDRLLAGTAVGPDAMDALLGAKQLILPTAMGERFQVIGLDKGVTAAWSGFSFRDLRDRLGDLETARPE